MTKRAGCALGLLLLWCAGATLAQKLPRPSTIGHAPPRDSLRTDLADYFYPTDAGRILTSVFAEHRRTHFHGGIDISTKDDIGYRVFASRDGYVARISVSPTGYGKSVWLRHADGFFTTYNHLSRFNDAIEALVRSEQLRLERYPVFIEPKPTDFPVRKGEVIAYTGATGTGSPHLHFEIRDAKKDFINPQLCKNIAFPDDSIPRIRRIALTPLAENSFINASPKSYVVEIENPIRRSIVLAETLHAFGVFGFAVDARDRINESRFNSGVYTHKLFLDDSLMFSVRFDRAPSQDDHQVRLHYDYDLMSEEDGRYERLYVVSPNRLPFYSPKTPSGGVIRTSEFGEGVHRFRIIVQDFKKNSTEISGAVVFSPPPEIRLKKNDASLTFDATGKNSATRFRIAAKALDKKAKNVRWREVISFVGSSSPPFSSISEPYDALKIEGWNERGTPALPMFLAPGASQRNGAAAELSHEIEAELVRVFMNTTGAFTSPPTIVLLENNAKRMLQSIPVDYNSYTATFRLLEPFSGTRTIIAECEVNGGLQTPSHDLTVHPINPAKPATISFDNGNVIVVADTAAFFKKNFLEVEKRGDAHYALLPRFTVLNRGIVVKMRRSPSRLNEALYYRNSTRGDWSLASTRREGNHVVDTLKRWLGDISLQSDTRSPFVTRLATPSRFNRQPHSIAFRFGDNLSGVDYKELKLYIDNTFVVPEIDGEHRRVVNRLPAPLKRGTHSIRIILKDRLGNTNDIRRTFRVR
jgi:hypothetical protein